MALCCAELFNTTLLLSPNPLHLPEASQESIFNAGIILSLTHDIDVDKRDTWIFSFSYYFTKTCCGCSLEMHLQAASNKYPQHNVLEEK